MEIELEIKNYRCFPDSKPVRIRIGNGFVALIGVNNSGKSSLLRFFYELRQVFDNSGQNELANLMNPLRHAGHWSFQFQGVTDAAAVFHKKNNRGIDVRIKVLFGADGGEPPAGHPRELCLSFDRQTKQIASVDIPAFCGDPANRQHLNIARRQGSTASLEVPGRPTVTLSHIAEALRALADTLYLGAFRNAVNVAAGQDYYDIKVGQSFITEWRKRKTGSIIEENEAINRLTGDIRRIFEFDTLEINASDDNQTLKILANDHSYRLEELGAGLAQFIFVLANAAIRRPSFILIDEPEQNLHPSLQIDFLTTLASYAKVGVIFGTHSIGLARAVGNRIYSLRRIADGESEVADYEATPRLSEFLGELSFSGYHELGFSKVLLVEGTTDVTTFQQFLRQYHKDHQVVILPMGGAGLINNSTEQQLGEIKRICNRIAAVIDSEKDRQEAAIDPVRLQFREMCQRVGISCHIVERRATENYLSDRAVKITKGNNFSALSPYESLGDHLPRWGKNENWRIAHEMTQDELSQTDLGNFLREL